MDHLYAILIYYFGNSRSFEPLRALIKKVHSWTFLINAILANKGPSDLYLRYRMMLQNKLVLRTIYFIASCS